MTSFSLPKLAQWQAAFDRLSKKEKIAFFSLFIVAWVSGIIVLRQFDYRFATQMPASGGSLTEGIVGTPRFINPLLAISDADRDLSQIVYASLMKPDGHGGLVPELAESYETSDDGLVYTFHLRENLFWHDNTPLTADDIVFTVGLAKNPAIRSTKFANWEGVGAIAKDARTVEFHLKSPFAPFMENSTLGILPKHIWENVPAEEFSASSINTSPIGSGPFYIHDVSKNSTNIITSYTLRPFKHYLPHTPYLSEIVFRFYHSENELEDALKNKSVDAGALAVPPESGLQTLSLELPRVVGVFLNQDLYTPFHDVAVRKAMNLAVDRSRIVQEALGGAGKPTSLAIPPGTFGYDEHIDDTTQNIDLARDILKKAGYTDSDGDGIVEKTEKKEKKPLEFTLTTANAPELVHTAELLTQMWHDIGIRVNVEPLEQGDLKESFIRPRNYQALLFGQIVGDDPDPYAFWHTSQRKHPGVNLALYANTRVDKILEDARQTSNDEKRKAMYKTFLSEVSKDTPAVFLYSNLMSYTVPKALLGLDIQHVPNPQSRFVHIDEWHVYTQYIWNIFAKKINTSCTLFIKML